MRGVDQPVNDCYTNAYHQTAYAEVHKKLVVKKSKQLAVVVLVLLFYATLHMPGVDQPAIIYYRYADTYYTVTSIIENSCTLAVALVIVIVSYCCTVWLTGIDYNKQLPPVKELIHHR